MSAIEVKNVSFSYDKKIKNIDDVSFVIEKGKYVSIVGHNGSGKSTLSRLLIGLLKAESGEIYINGTLLEKKSIRDIRKQVAIVFQNPDNQFIGATVEDDIAFGLENRCIPQEKMKGIVYDYASKVGMQEYLDKEPSHLSGGQKQRVAIAGALALAPQILILDEATSMLDPKGKLEIKKLVLEMIKNNPELTVISITHDIEEAYLSDEILILSKGKLVLSGNPEEILNNDEILKRYSLHKPFLLQFNDSLNENGINIKKTKDIDELVEALWELK